MAIGKPGSIYDINRDMYFDASASQTQYEKEMFYRRQEDEYRRRKEEEHRRMQSLAITYAGRTPNETPKADPNDPLAFLKKSDSKLLLTGEAT